MKNYKFLLTIVANFVWLSNISTQSLIHSNASGKTVYFNTKSKPNIEHKEMEANATLYSDAIDSMVFTSPYVIDPTNLLLNVEPPIVAFRDTKLRWGGIARDTTLTRLREFYPQLVNSPTGYGIYHSKKLLVGDRFYELYLYGYWNTYLTCKDALSGNILWDVSFNLTTQDRADLDNNIYVRSDGNLEVSGWRMGSDAFLLLFPLGYPSRKIFDPENGQLLGKYYKEFKDGGTASINQNGQLGQLLPIEEDEKYLLVESFIDNSFKQLLASRTVDAVGKVLETVDIIDNVVPRAQFVMNFGGGMNKLPNGNFVTAHSTFFNPGDVSTVYPELIYYDQGGRFLRRIDLRPFISGTPYMNVRVEGADIMVTGITYTGATESSYLNHLLIIDQDGVVKVNLSGFKSLDGEACRDISLCQYENGGYLAVGSDGSDCLKYFLIGADSKVRHLKTSCHIVGDTWILFPRYIGIAKTGDIIVGNVWKHKSDPAKFGFEGSFALESAELFGTSASNDVSTSVRTSVYPNPTNGRLTFDSVERNAIIRLRDLHGQVLLTSKLQDNQLDIAHLPNGIYIIDIDSDGRIERQKIVKIR